jgi:phage gp46-like protein
MDVALQYDPVTGCCDVAFDGRDFALDDTPASAMLFSILADRRARPDDVLPDTVPDYTAPSTLMARRGSPTDCLDPNGNFTGSRFWLFSRAKATEQTRQGIETAVAESVEWLETVRNLAVQVTVRWVKPGWAGIRVRAGKTTLSLVRALS